MTGPDHDAEFEAFLKRRSPMHRRLADFDHAEPSAEVDRLVLTRARQAIDTPAQPPMFRKARWAMPLGIAATILIAFTVVLNLDHRAQRTEKPVASTKSGQPAVPAAQLTANRPADATRPAADTREAAKSAVAGSAGNDASASAAAPAPAPGREDSRLEKKAERAPLLASTRAGYLGPIDTPPTAEAASTEGEADAAASKEEERSSRSLSDQPLLASGSASASVTDRAAADAAAASPPSAARPAYQGSAESWLREINRLRAAGKTAAADRELTAFLQAYPSHPGHALARPPTR